MNGLSLNIIKRLAKSQFTQCRGIRGANSVSENTPEAIRQATLELMQEIVRRNCIVIEDVTSVLFSLTRDLNADFPGKFAREVGYARVPMLHFSEIEVPNTLERCLRVLVHVNTSRGQHEIQHVYLNKASGLRSDLAQPIPS